MKILVVDDDKDQLFIRGMLLRENGFDAIEASDSGSAVAQAAAYKPECALVDLRLPTEDAGLRLIRDLKALDGAIHLFVLTGANATRLAVLPEKALIDEIVLKGSPSADLIQKLKALAQ